MLSTFTGMTCAACHHPNNYSPISMDLWCFEDYPEASFLHIMCVNCKRSMIYYLGETWQDDMAFLVGIGIVSSTEREATATTLQGFLDTFGYSPLDSYQEKELRFAAYLLDNQAAECSLTDWEVRYGQG